MDATVEGKRLENFQQRNGEEQDKFPTIGQRDVQNAERSICTYDWLAQKQSVVLHVDNLIEHCFRSMSLLIAVLKGMKQLMLLLNKERSDMEDIDIIYELLEFCSNSLLYSSFNHPFKFVFVIRSFFVFCFNTYIFELT